MKKNVILLLLICAGAVGCSRDVPAGNPLSRGWSYAVGAVDETPADCEKKEFQNIDFLRNLERFLPDREGFVWLKNEFYLTEDLKSRPLSLFLGRITMADEAYLNGYLVGHTGKFPP
ncbi:MAG: hypothetical protein ACRCUT_13965, partial [Spirochaetota bacterium]